MRSTVRGFCGGVLCAREGAEITNPSSAAKNPTAANNEGFVGARLAAPVRRNPHRDARHDSRPNRSFGFSIPSIGQLAALAMNRNLI